MIIKPFYELCPGMQSFIKFYTSINKDKFVPIIGYELYCCDPECDCRIVSIMMHHERTKKYLVTIQYGWDKQEHYTKEQFIESDVDNFINGGLMLLEEKTPQNLSILESFQSWLVQDEKTKKQLFADRYQQFKLAISGKGFDSRKYNDYFMENLSSMLQSGIFNDLITNKTNNIK